MAEPAKQGGENESMEDILQSIKRIIETDESKPKTDAAPLDLTQALAEDGSVLTLKPMQPEPAPAPAPTEAAAPAADIMQTIDDMFAPTPAAAPISVEPSAPTPPAPAPAQIDEGLLSQQAALAAANSLKSIADSARKDYGIPFIPSPEFRNGHTVEELVIEALRPMLKEWLDEHLPTIVHKIVEREVKRIVMFHHNENPV